MSTVARYIASTPNRTASETWDKIVSLLAPDPDSPARSELEGARGIASSSISSEALANDAFIVSGSGPQVRVYCVFNDDAISGDGVNEDRLVQSATEGDWRLSIPCPSEDLEWSTKKLASAGKRITARAIGEGISETKADKVSTNRVSGLKINTEEFLKP